MDHTQPTNLQTILLGDQTASKLNNENIIVCDHLSSIGAGDTVFVPNFLTIDEATQALNNLNVGGEIDYQQWYHMPDKKNKLIPLSRLKIAMADTDKDGWTPHYRFPVNSQDQHGVFPFDLFPL
jgi:hypothetical protein